MEDTSFSAGSTSTSSRVKSKEARQSLYEAFRLLQSETIMTLDGRMTDTPFLMAMRNLVSKRVPLSATRSTSTTAFPLQAIHCLVPDL